MWALSAALVGALLAGEPECSTYLRNCVYTRAGVDFGDNAWDMALGRDLTLPPGPALSSMCSKKNWAHRDTCRVDCPLKLVVTEPAAYKMEICLEDSFLEPFVGSSHLSKGHRALDTVMDHVLVGNPAVPSSHFACTPTDFMMTRKSFVGKIAVFQRGGCIFFLKFILAKMFGASAGVLINTAPYPTITQQRMVRIVGLSDMSEGVPAMVATWQAAIPIMNALTAGVPLKGKFTLTCPPFGVVPPPTSPPVSDSCPDPGLIGKCNHMEAAEDRLCSKCSMQLTHTAYPSLRACLWGNSLLPRLPATLLWTQHTPPTQLTVAYVVGSSSMGCSPADYAGLGGKVVMLAFPAACLPSVLVHAAQGAGVAGVILLTPKLSLVTQVVDGTSQFISIPAHSVEPQNWQAIDDAFRNGGVPLVGTAAGVSAFEMSVSAVDGTPAPQVNVATPAPPLVFSASVEELEASGLQFTAGVVVAFFLAVVLLAACLFVIHKQKKEAVDLPANGDKGFEIPLSAASMGLSLSLLLLVAIVAFSLTFTAGQDAKNTAVADGEEASAQNYRNAIANVLVISNQNRLNVLGQVTSSLNNILDQGENMANSVTALYLNSDSTWDSLYSKYEEFISLLVSVPLWRPAVIAKNGLFFSYRTRNREELNGVRLSDTNDGHTGGCTVTLYNDATKVTYPNTFYLPHDSMYWHRLGTEYGDAFAFTDGLPMGAMKYHLSTKTAIQESGDDGIYLHPLSVYTPLYNRHRQHLGYVQTDLELSSIADAVKAATNIPALENMTTVIFEAGTNNIVSTTAHKESFTYLQLFIGSYLAGFQLYKLDEIPSVPLVALSHALRGRDEISEVVDQKKSFVPPVHENEVLNLGVRAGVVRDSAQVEFKTEMRGLCAATGTCVGTDGTDSIMRFYGDNVLNVYKNNTIDSPDVAASRISAPGAPWASKYHQYNFVMTVPGTTGSTPAEQCVYKTSILAGVPEKCSLKRPFLEESYTVHTRFRPNADIDPLDNQQRLFGDAWGGAGLLRLYASGIMSMNVMTYGCKTEPLSTPMKGGVWHSVTAVLDRTAGTCTTYINGKHHSTGRISNPEGKGRYGDVSGSLPYVVGQNFEGDMSSLTVWEMPLVPEEIATLHRTRGVLERHVPRKRWLADVRRFVRNTTTSREINWRMGVMVPEEDVMRDIDANNAATLKNLDVQTENLNRKLQQKSYEVILIVVVLVLFSVLVFLLFNNALTQPFARVAVVMTEVAVMRIDEVPDLSSRLLEMNAIHRAMILMCRNLKEYRSYMPQSILADTTDDEAYESEPQTRTSSAGSDKNSLASASHSKSAKVTDSSKIANEIGMKRGAMALSLTKKRVSFTLVNICDWHGRVSNLSEQRTIQLHSGILEKILGTFATTKGISEMFSGDRFLCGYNGAKQLGSHRMAACDAACRIAEAMGTEDLKISCAVASGDARVGNMGCDDMKRFAYITPVLTWCYALERYARAKNVAMMCDSWVAQDASAEYTLKLAGTVEFKKRTVKPIVLHELICKKAAAAEDEWMYQMDAADKADPYSKWNAFVEKVTAKDFDVCHTTPLRSRPSLPHTTPHHHRGQKRALTVLETLTPSMHLRMQKAVSRASSQGFCSAWKTRRTRMKL